ncbi:hypothetical protein ASD97_39270 [Streptomyces sp. Root63]|nr:hypothetical protein ASD29_00150 [Streptomyces sp. Root1295]KRA45846.1 hypothetical protein ASD97_39270 [Streptomyces sp. Root63]
MDRIVAMTRRCSVWFDDFLRDLTAADPAVAHFPDAECPVDVPGTADAVVAFAALLSWCGAQGKQRFLLLGSEEPVVELVLGQDRPVEAVRQVARRLTFSGAAMLSLAPRSGQQGAAVPRLYIRTVPGRAWLGVEGGHGRVREDRLTELAARLGVLAVQVGSARGVFGDLDPWTALDSQGQRERWNGKQIAVPQQTIPALVAPWVERTPAAVAVTYSGGTLTYRQLWQAAASVAGALSVYGVRPGDRVASLVSPGHRSVVVFLGMLLAGVCHVPIDHRAPAARARAVVADSGARLVVAADGVADEFDVPGLLLDDLLTCEGAGRTLLPVQPDADAYMLYTSGTTGRPKGVTITHANVVNTLAGVDDVVSFTDRDVWTLFHSCTFDFSVFEIFGCLAHGGRLVALGQPEIDDPLLLYGALERESVTVLCQTPSAFTRLIALDEAGAEELTSLRQVVFGGERLDPRVLGNWLRRHPSVRLTNMFGISEATIHSTAHDVTADDVSAARSPIGRPLRSVELHLVDDRGHLVADGAVGEIWLGGASVAGGYHNLPEVSRERFVVPRWGGKPLLRTGDLARRGPDGVLEYLRRKDDQFQWHGYRIEPGEIVGALLGYPGVSVAEVVATDGPQARIAAFVVAAGDTSLNPERLASHAASLLPHYMVPQAIHVIGTLPVTSNGKTDRKFLADLDAECGRATPLSTPQQHLFTASRLAADPDQYVETAVWQVRGQGLNTDALRHALSELTSRHHILRTRFLLKEGRALQRLRPPWRPALKILSLPETGAGQRQLLEATGGLCPVDADAGSVIAAAVVRTGDDEEFLVLRQHHLVTDARSVGALVGDLAACYRAAVERTVLAPWPGGQYRDVAAVAPSADAVGHAVQRLSGAAAVLLPQPPRRQRDGMIRVEVPIGAAAAARAARDHRATVFVLHASALAAALHVWLGRADVTFGITVDGAGAAAGPPVLGPLVMTAPVRSRQGVPARAADLVRPIAEQVALILDDGGAACAAAAERLHPPAAGLAPYCEVLLSSAGVEQGPVDFGRSELVPVRLPASGRREGHPVVVTAYASLDGLGFDIAYQGEWIDKNDARELAVCLTDAVTWLFSPREGTAPQATAPAPPHGGTAISRRPARARIVPPRQEPVARAGNRAEELTAVVLEIWRDVLPPRQKAFGASEDFFEAGGNSIALLSLHMRLESSLGCDIAISDLFVHRTARSQAVRLADVLEGGAS